MKKLFFALMLFSTVASATEAKLCSSKTKAGADCKSAILMQDGKCRAHSELSPRCGAVTKAGSPCKWVVKTDGEKCKNHLITSK